METNGTDQEIQQLHADAFIRSLSPDGNERLPSPLCTLPEVSTADAGNEEEEEVEHGDGSVPTLENQTSINHGFNHGEQVRVDEFDADAIDRILASYPKRTHRAANPPEQFRNCWFYGKDAKLPEVEDIVIGVVQEYGEMGVYINLVEYGYIDAMALITEIGRRRRRRVPLERQYPPNTFLPFTVIRVDREKGKGVLVLYSSCPSDDLIV